MIAIFRTSENTIGEVVRQAKYALRGKPILSSGDTILIAQAVSSIRDNRPPIRYRMQFVRAYRDVNGESQKIWGRQWLYMVEGSNCLPLERPFDIRQFQVTSKNYAQGGTVVYVEPEDEAEIRKHGLLETISVRVGDKPFDSTEHRNRKRLTVQEEPQSFSSRKLSLEDIRSKVVEFNHRYRDAVPSRRRVLSERIARPGNVSDYLKQLNNFTCQLCGLSGFRKKNGTFYIEAHHIAELHRLLPGSYCSDNIVVVCPTCHRKLHYASVSYSFAKDQVMVIINGESFSFKRNILSE